MFRKYLLTTTIAGLAILAIPAHATPAQYGSVDADRIIG